MKTYKFGGKTVKAVKETNLCEGCAFNTGLMEFECMRVNQEKAKVPKS